jgi:5-methylcytosine-specific restriction endonuclease McrA
MSKRAKAQYRRYLQSEWWKYRRVRALVRVWYLCQKCKQAWARQVHHRHYNSLGSERDEDLMALCERCHRIVHGLKVDE